MDDDNKLEYGPHIDWVADWNKNRDCGDILFLYEGMELQVSFLQGIAAFLGIDVTDEFCEKVMADLDLVKLKNDKTLMHPTVRVGGGLDGCFMWQKWFTVGQNEWFDAKFKEQYDSMDSKIEMHYE